ncbi:MAG: DNA-3-methyladenine glycosylase family protein [Acidimicrobiales bacterium]
MSVTLELRPFAPFCLELTVWALRRRARNKVDLWDGRYHRVLVVDGRPLTLVVEQRGTPDSPRLTLSVSGRDRDITAERVQVARRVLERSLGLNIDLRDFYHLAQTDSPLADLVTRFRGVKPPRFPTVFESLTNAVACQQLSLEVGIELLNRLSDAYGEPSGDGPSPLKSFPEPAVIAVASPHDLRQLGFSAQKSDTLIRLATAVGSGEVDRLALSALPREEATMALRGLKGIGRWSAEYVLLRGFGRLDIFPGDDVGARKKLRSFFELPDAPDYAAINRLTSRWAPYAGMVYFHFLLDGLVGRGILAARDSPPT